MEAISEISTKVTTNSDPKTGASSEGDVLSERIRGCLTEGSLLNPFGIEKRIVATSGFSRSYNAD